MADPDPEPTRFTAECQVIARLMSDHKPGDLDPAEEDALATAMSYVLAALPRLLTPRVKNESQSPEDIAQEALAKFVTAAGAGQVNPGGSPAGYLLTIALNLLRDEARSARPVTLPLSDGVPLPETGVDDLTRLLDRLASAESVRRALRRAFENGDRMALDVIRAWLDLAHQLGEEPPSRAVAEEVGISKSTVANVLERFKGYLTADWHDDRADHAGQETPDLRTRKRSSTQGADSESE